MVALNDLSAQPTGSRRANFNFFNSRIAVGGACLIIFWILVALLAPVLAPYSPSEIDYLAISDPTPSTVHWLGTDQLGRDILSRIIWGARTVLLVGPMAALGAAALGSTLGVTAAYYGGWVDVFVTRVADIVLTFPVILFYLVIIVAFGASATAVVCVLIVTNAPIVARIIRSVAVDLRRQDYILAAKMRGESALYIMFVEILPNARNILIVDLCLRIGFCIFMIGVFGFLGVGLPPPTPDWGGMVKDTYGMMSIWPHMSLFPCGAISSLVIGFNLLATGLRELNSND